MSILPTRINGRMETVDEWRARWKKINDVTDAGYRRLTVADRFRQLARLMAFAKSLKRRSSRLRKADNEKARERWRMFREACGG
jgi:hypothetical protein